MFTVLVILGLFIFMAIVTPLLLKQEDLATSQFQNLDVSTIINILIYAFILTSLSEEILFRGFLTKRILSKFGFGVANAVQSILFGLLHGVVFSTAIGGVSLVAIIALTAFTGWMMGYINEKQASSSIVPSWILHGIANTFSSLLAVFMIIG